MSVLEGIYAGVEEPGRTARSIVRCLVFHFSRPCEPHTSSPESKQEAETKEHVKNAGDECVVM